jgi:hypothetical protein
MARRLLDRVLAWDSNIFLAAGCSVSPWAFHIAYLTNGKRLDQSGFFDSAWVVVGGLGLFVGMLTPIALFNFTVYFGGAWNDLLAAISDPSERERVPENLATIIVYPILLVGLYRMFFVGPF